jgi:hypothetical protein
MLLIAAASLLAAGPPSSGDHEWVGVGKCRSCHKKEGIGNQIAWWEQSEHAKAFETLGSDEAKKWAEEAGVGDPQKADECLRCHTSAHGVPKEMLSKKFDSTLGVQCESCHGAGKDYRKKKVMRDRDLAISKGLVPQSEEVCIVCHNDESPAWDPERYTRPDGTKVGFDYDLAVEEIGHPVPEGYDPDSEGEAD